MKLFAKKDKPPKVKHGIKFKTFFTAALFFEKAYPDSAAAFPKAEIIKARNTLSREDVLDAFAKLKTWNDALPEPNAELRRGLVELSAVL